ncbi:MAG TPA: reverse transcriptase family protein [Ignavibacteria bacterium]|nr:reverse transcriptase family protein [Ignavibacteria bacterium]HRK01015.1 reverse transcriptase family protein [Ignavibacteria bacterium]
MLKSNSGKVKYNVEGKPIYRILNPSIKRLEKIQERIKTNILDKLLLPDYAFGAVKKKDNVKNAKKHQGKKFKFVTDLKNFFPSISNKKVFEMFLSFDFSPTVSRKLTQLTTYKGKLPQGTQTSSAIANLVFIKTGKNLQNFAKENNITFTSFLDDLSFSSPIDFKDKTYTILDIIKSDGFFISHKKTKYGVKAKITGLYPKQNYLDLPNSFKTKIKNVDGKTEEQIRGEKLYEEKVKKTNHKFVW